MNISFADKVALVTGSGSGLGLATAQAFAEAGASVALADWNEKAVRSAAATLAASGHKALAIRCDISNDAEVEAMVREIIAKFGRLDVAYNNAGVQNELAETADTTAKDYDRVMGINLRGIWNSMKFELQHRRHRQLFLSRRSGRRRGAWHLSRCEARCAGIHQERGAGIRRQGHSHQRRVSRTHSNAHVGPNGRGGSG